MSADELFSFIYVLAAEEAGGREALEEWLTKTAADMEFREHRFDKTWKPSKDAAPDQAALMSMMPPAERRKPK